MQTTKLIEILNTLSPYTSHDDFIETEHEEIYIPYKGTLSEPVYKYLMKESSCDNLGENYQDYVANREDFDNYLMFYI